MIARRYRRHAATPKYAQEHTHVALEPSADPVRVHQREERRVVEWIGRAGPGSDHGRIVADHIGDRKDRNERGAARVQRDGKPSGAPSQHATAYRVHFVNRESRLEQRFGKVGDVRLCAIGVADGVRKRRHRSRRERRGTTGQQHDHDVGRRDIVHGRFDRIGCVERCGPRHRMIARHHTQHRWNVGFRRRGRRGVHRCVCALGAHDEAAGQFERCIGKCACRARRHGRRGFAKCDDMDTRIGGELTTVGIDPLAHGVTRARKRRRALHGSTIECDEKGAGNVEQLRNPSEAYVASGSVTSRRQPS